MQKNIYVLYGGPSTEHEVSITSARTLINNLSKEKYNVSAIFVRRDKKFIMKENITEEIKSDDELVLDSNRICQRLYQQNQSRKHRNISSNSRKLRRRWNNPRFHKSFGFAICWM